MFVRGDQISGEYGGRSALDPDGWFATRDIGRMDADGYLFIEGRADDTIIRGGENIAPAEIEDVLVAHPGITEAAVVGVPDPEWGQRLVAVVVGAGDPDEIKRWVRTGCVPPRLPMPSCSATNCRGPKPGSCCAACCSPNWRPPMPEAVIVSALRTPIGTAFKGTLRDTNAFDLADVIVRAAADGLDTDLVDDVILGEGLYGGGVIARHAAITAGLPAVPGLARTGTAPPVRRLCRARRRPSVRAWTNW